MGGRLVRTEFTAGSRKRSFVPDLAVTTIDDQRRIGRHAWALNLVELRLLEKVPAGMEPKQW